MVVCLFRCLIVCFGDCVSVCLCVSCLILFVVVVCLFFSLCDYFLCLCLIVSACVLGFLFGRLFLVGGFVFWLRFCVIVWLFDCRCV